MIYLWVLNQQTQSPSPVGATEPQTCLFPIMSNAYLLQRELITDGLIRGRTGIRERTEIGDIQAKARDKLRRILKSAHPSSIEEGTLKQALENNLRKWKTECDQL